MDAKDIIRQKRAYRYYTQQQQTTPQEDVRIAAVFQNSYPSPPPYGSFSYSIQSTQPGVPLATALTIDNTSGGTLTGSTFISTPSVASHFGTTTASQFSPLTGAVFNVTAPVISGDHWNIALYNSSNASVGSFDLSNSAYIPVPTPSGQSAVTYSTPQLFSIYLNGPAAYFAVNGSVVASVNINTSTTYYFYVTNNSPYSSTSYKFSQISCYNLDNSIHPNGLIQPFTNFNNPNSYLGNN